MTYTGSNKDDIKNLEITAYIPGSGTTSYEGHHWDIFIYMKLEYNFGRIVMLLYMVSLKFLNID